MIGKWNGIVLIVLLFGNIKAKNEVKGAVGTAPFELWVFVEIATPVFTGSQ